MSGGLLRMGAFRPIVEKYRLPTASTAITAAAAKVTHVAPLLLLTSIGSVPVLSTRIFGPGLNSVVMRPRCFAAGQCRLKPQGSSCSAAITEGVARQIQD